MNYIFPILLFALLTVLVCNAYYPAPLEKGDCVIAIAGVGVRQARNCKKELGLLVCEGKIFSNFTEAHCKD